MVAELGRPAEALEAAPRAVNDQQRAAVLASFVAQLTGPLLSEALASALSIADESQRVDAIAALAPHLVSLQLGEALESTLEIEDEALRTRAMEVLAPHLIEQLPIVFFAPCSNAFRRLVSRSRGEIFCVS